MAANVPTAATAAEAPIPSSNAPKATCARRLSLPIPNGPRSLRFAASAAAGVWLFTGGHDTVRPRLWRACRDARREALGVEKPIKIESACQRPGQCRGEWAFRWS